MGHAPSPTYPETASTSAADALLGLYDCYQDPSKVHELIDIIGAWLEGECHEVALGEFETHSDKLWSLLSSHLGADKPQERRSPTPTALATPESAYAYLDRSLTLLNDPEGRCLADQMRAEDVGRFKAWVAEGQSLPLILRRYGFSNGDRADDVCGPTLLILHAIPHGSMKVPQGAVSYFEPTELSLSNTMEAMFQTSFSLTAAEMRVLRLLVLGENGASIADTVGRTRETIKSQIKSICGKLGVSSQNEIIAAVRQVELQIAHTPLQQQPELKGDMLHLPGGSTIAFRSYGPRAGVPMLLVHGLLSGRHLADSVLAPLNRAGVRLIVPARPGYGATTLDSYNPSTTLQQTVVNMARLAQALSISRLALLADGMGLMFALEFARQYPGLCGPIMALDPHPPLLSEADLESYEGRYRKVSITNLKSKGALETLFRLAYLDAKAANSPQEMLSRHAFRDEDKLIGTAEPSDLEARWANLQENLSSEFKHLTQESELIKTDFLHFPPGSNLRPKVCVFCTTDNPYVTPKAITDVADRLYAPIINAGPALPHISGQLSVILRELQTYCE